MPEVRSWIKEQRAVFFDNAPARKDYRVQLRGSRTLFQWGIFLFLIMLVAYLSYTSLGNQNEGKISLQYAQSQLQSFYEMTLGLLGGLVALIAPAIGATSVVVERQRRFLDLILSSPMSGRYYLTGKLISSYRNIWMLLILSLPIVAMGAVLGGATYGDVFKTFLVISLDGVIFSCVALSISAGAQKLPSALLFSYMCTGVIIGFSTSLAGAAMIRGMGSKGSQEMSIIGMLSPFTAPSAIETVTKVGNIDIPNWLIFIPFTFLAVQVCLLGGVSALATKTVKATVWFRILTLPLVSWLSYSFIGISRVAHLSHASGQEMVWPFAFMAVVIPFFACFRADGPLKFVYDGGPKLKNTFKASPSGSIGYIGCLLSAMFVGAIIGLTIQGNLQDTLIDLEYLVWLGGLYVLTWSVCQFTSQFAGTLTAARALATILVSVGLSIVSITAGAFDTGSGPPMLSPMSVLTGTHPLRALIWGMILGLLGTGLAYVKLPKFFATLAAYG